MPDIRIGSRPFAQQVDFFQRKVSVPTGGWWDLQRADHAHGFMVAGAFKADLLDDLRGIVQGAIERGTPIDQFRKEFDSIVAKHGWDYRGGRNWRTRIIYETNIRQSYNAGRWQQLTSPAMRQARPYLEYRHNDKGRSKDPRPLHVSWNGLVLRSDDAWWDAHAPMNGWHCKCGIRALSEADLKSMGKAGPDTAPDDGRYDWTAPDGSQHQIPNGVDPGFDYNGGAQARSLPAARRFGERVMQMPPEWRSRALDDAARNARDWHADAGSMLGAMIEERYRPRGQTMAVGMLHSTVVDYLASRGQLPATAMVAVVDSEIAHMWRDSKATRIRTLPEDLVRSLPQQMAAPNALLYDLEDPGLIYAWRLADGRYAKAIVRLNYRQKGMLERAPANLLRSGGIVGAADLRTARYTLINGELK